MPEAFWWVFIVGVAYLGLCVLFTIGWSLLMKHNKRCTRQVERDRFQEHLDRCTEIVDDWPTWKQSVLGPHIMQERREINDEG